MTLYLGQSASARKTLNSEAIAHIHPKSELKLCSNNIQKIVRYY